jgi:hypothetical protein
LGGKPHARTARVVPGISTGERERSPRKLLTCIYTYYIYIYIYIYISREREVTKEVADLQYERKGGTEGVSERETLPRPPTTTTPPSFLRLG